MESSNSKNDINRVRISFIIEWANTSYNGVPRFWGLIDLLTKQWQAMLSGQYPENLPAEAIEFVKCLNDLPEVLITSGEKIAPHLEQEIHHRTNNLFALRILVKEGLEYYALKNYGATFATGDIYCFMDSDIHPNKGWLAHFFGSFSHADIRIVMGQTYIKPIDLFSKAFALGWIYPLKSNDGKLLPTPKIYTNNIAFKAELFQKINFPTLNRRTRGASRMLISELAAQDITVWENRKARVDHPPPSSFKHMIIRALAHGRDEYMRNSDERTFDGLLNSQKVAVQRMSKGYSRTFSNGKKVGAKIYEIPVILAIITCYYFFMSMGGLLTHISPKFMGRCCRL